MGVLRGILFDKDGTLLDFDATWAPATLAVLTSLAQGDETTIARLADACGFDTAALTFEPHSPIIAGDTAAFAPRWAELAGRVWDAGFEAHVNELYRHASLQSLTAYGDVAHGLDTLVAAGFRIGLATNDSEGTARAHLAALGLEDRFCFIAGYDTGHGAKPGPGMVLAFARAAGIRPDEVALVGDSTHDMDAARAAGARAIGIARTQKALEALDGHTDVTILDFRGLLAHLAG